jgi:hypothetical protein
MGLLQLCRLCYPFLQGLQSQISVVKKQHKKVDQKHPFCYNRSIVRNKELKMTLRYETVGEMITQHQQEKFESNVTYIVRPLLNDNEHAGFFGETGTLFAACSESTARSIFDRLSLEFGVGKVQLNGPIQGEYAYDFV